MLDHLYTVNLPCIPSLRSIDLWPGHLVNLKMALSLQNKSTAKSKDVAVVLKAKGVRLYITKYFTSDSQPALCWFSNPRDVTLVEALIRLESSVDGHLSCVTCPNKAAVFIEISCEVGEGRLISASQSRSFSLRHREDRTVQDHRAIWNTNVTILTSLLCLLRPMAWWTVHFNITIKNYYFSIIYLYLYRKKSTLLYPGPEITCKNECIQINKYN